MRPMLHQHAIFESAWLALVGVADEIFDVALRAAGELPFQTGGESGAAPPDQAGSFHLGDHFVGGHSLDCLSQGSIVAIIFQRFRRGIERGLEQDGVLVAGGLEIRAMPFAQQHINRGSRQRDIGLATRAR